MSRIAFALIASALVVSPALAAPIVVAAPLQSFRGLEYRYQGQQLIDVARSSLAEAIPVGTPLDQARTLLRRAGTSCGEHRPGTLRCTASSFEAVEDHLHDVVWTVDVAHDANRVTGVSVDRESIGS